MRKAFVVALNYKEEKLYELEIDISNEKFLDVIINWCSASIYIW